MTPSATTVLVLAGGDSAERDVSLESAHGIARALIEAGYNVLVADPARPHLKPGEDFGEVFKDSVIREQPPVIEEDAFANRAEFIRVLSAYQAYGIDIVFSGLHGGAGEDGTIQAVLEYIGVPFTGSGAAACALAMDKNRSKCVAAAAGVAVARGAHFSRDSYSMDAMRKSVLELTGLPAVVKPNAQGSSVGLTIVEDIAGLERAVEAAFATDSSLLIEQYIAGREVTQAVLAGESEIPIVEIRPRSGLYDYFHKYQPGNSEYLVPAPLDEAVARRINTAAQRTFAALGLSVYARVDFRLDDAGNCYLLEANTLPGMTATSLVPKACAPLGIDFPGLCDRIVRASLKRFER